MPDFLNQRINPPEFWQEFEKLCADLWGEIWKDSNTQMHGRSGQAQHGVDVFGRKDGNGDWVGVQCKGKDGRYGHFVTENELKKEVENAINFTPPIKEFILATTAQNDATIQKIAREITESHKTARLFSVQVLGWNEIHRRLSDYPHLIEKYYSNQGPAVQKILEKLDSINDSQFVNEGKNDKRILDQRRPISEEVILDVTKLLISSGVLPDSSNKSTSTGVDAVVNNEINGYRDLILKNQAKTALDLLEKLKERHWDTANDQTKFRILTNIASSHLNLGDKELASREFLEAEKYSPNDEKAMCNVALAHLLTGKKIMRWILQKRPSRHTQTVTGPILFLLKVQLTIKGLKNLKILFQKKCRKKVKSRMPFHIFTKFVEMSRMH